MSPLVHDGETGRMPVTSQLWIRPMTPTERQQHEDLQWAATAPEVQQHEGKLVVVRKKRVIAVGTDQRSLLAHAATEEQCSPTELVVELVPGRGLWETPIDVSHMNPMDLVPRPVSFG